MLLDLLFTKCKYFIKLLFCNVQVRVLKYKKDQKLINVTELSDKAP